MKYSFSLLLFLSLCAFVPESETLTDGIELYDNRAEGAVGLKANPENLFKALTIFQNAFNRKEDLEISGLYLMRTQEYIARFIETETEKKKQRFEAERKIGEQLVKLYPNSAPVRFAYISAIGLWAEQVGAMKSAKDGVLGKMKEQVEALIKIDSMYNNAAGYKVMGLMNLKTPYIPFFLTWPSDKEGKRLVEKALKYFPKDHGNNYYYAEVLEKFGLKDRAKLYVNVVLALPCRKELLLEDRKFQEDAKQLLAAINK